MIAGFFHSLFQDFFVDFCLNFQNLKGIPQCYVHLKNQCLPPQKSGDGVLVFLKVLERNFRFHYKLIDLFLCVDLTGRPAAMQGNSQTKKTKTIEESSIAQCFSSVCPILFFFLFSHLTIFGIVGRANGLLVYDWY